MTFNLLKRLERQLALIISLYINKIIWRDEVICQSEWQVFEKVRDRKEGNISFYFPAPLHYRPTTLYAFKISLLQVFFPILREHVILQQLQWNAFASAAES